MQRVQHALATIQCKGHLTALGTLYFKALHLNALKEVLQIVTKLLAHLLQVWIFG